MAFDRDRLSVLWISGPVRYNLLWWWLLAIDRRPEVGWVVLNNALMLTVDHLTHQLKAALIRLASSMTSYPTIAHRYDWCWALSQPSIGSRPLHVTLKHAIVCLKMWVVVATASWWYDAVSGVHSCRHVCDVNIRVCVTKLRWRRLLLVLILRHWK